MQTVSFNLETFIIRSKTNQSIDRSASIEAMKSAFTKAIDELISREQIKEEDVAKAVQTAWDNNPGEKRMSIGDLQFETMKTMTFPRTAREMVGRRISSYVRSQPDTYHIGTGINGGVWLIARADDVEIAMIKEQRTKAALKNAVKQSVSSAPVSKNISNLAN